MPSRETWSEWRPPQSILDIEKGDAFMFLRGGLRAPLFPSYVIAVDPKSKMVILSNKRPGRSQAGARRFEISVGELNKLVREGLVHEGEYVKTWEEVEEEKDDEIRDALEKEIEDLANMSAAEAYSTLGAFLIDKYGDNVWVEAEFGDHTAVNGEIAPQGVDIQRPEDWVLTREGGHVPSAEEEVERKRVIEFVARKLGFPEERVSSVADEVGYDESMWTSVSGSTAIYVPEGVARQEDID